MPLDVTEGRVNAGAPPPRPAWETAPSTVDPPWRSADPAGVYPNSREFPGSPPAPRAAVQEDLAALVASAPPGGDATDEACTSCWSPLPAGLDECPNCGESVAEMRAARRAREQADAAWSPHRTGGEEFSPEPGAEHGARGNARGLLDLLPGLPEWLPSLVPRLIWAVETRARSILTLLAVIAALIGSAAGGRILAESTSAPSPLVDLDVQRGREARGGIATVRWNNPLPELALELHTPRGRAVARSGKAATVKLRAGKYRLRVLAPGSRWDGATQPIQVRAGETVPVTPAPEAIADYLGFKAEAAAREGSTQAAEQFWRRAVATAPRHLPARLGLAHCLAGQFRLDEAREHLRAAAAIAPDDPRIGRLLAAVDSRR